MAKPARAPASVEVIVATYRNPRALDLALAALARQEARGFAVCVAEDAEDPATAAVAARHGARHLHQPDAGFRKNRILNAAIRTSTADFLVFLDGDCLAHPGFVARHVALARADGYASGGIVRLSRRASDAVTPADVASGRIWTRDWQAAAGVRDRLGNRAKLVPPRLGAVLDRLSLARRRWLGSNASTFRDNLLSVNGFDETLDYGAEDKELGVRLENRGIRPYSLRYTAQILHLEHARDYVASRRNEANLALIQAHRRNGATWTAHGIFGPDAPPWMQRAGRRNSLDAGRE